LPIAADDIHLLHELRRLLGDLGGSLLRRLLGDHHRLRCTEFTPCYAHSVTCAREWARRHSFDRAPDQHERLRRVFPADLYLRQ
jgi:hypothetical protein